MHIPTTTISDQPVNYDADGIQGGLSQFVMRNTNTYTHTHFLTRADKA